MLTGIVIGVVGVAAVVGVLILITLQLEKHWPEEDGF